MKHIFLITFIFLVGSFNAQSKKEQIELLNKRVDSLNEVVGTERKTNLDKSNKISELTKTITNLESSIFSLNADVSRLTSEFQQSKTESATKTQDLAKLQTQLKTKTDSLVLILGELEKLKPAQKPVVNNNATNQVTQTGSFKSVKIGTQTWMTENLNVSTFRNGDPIPEAKTNEEWEKAGKAGKPAWCYYDNDPNNGKKYGKLYNLHAVNDERGLAPKGWRLANFYDWDIFLNDDRTEGKKLKSSNGWESWEEVLTCQNCKVSSAEFKKICPVCKGTGKNGKKTHSGNGDNVYGFLALPGGRRNENGDFKDKFTRGDWWVAGNNEPHYIRNDSYILGNVLFLVKKGDGRSVRCVKLNEEIHQNILYGKFLDERNKFSYKTVLINNETWMAENLNVDRFRNGDIIPEAKNEDEWKKAGENGKPMSCYYNFDNSIGAKYGKLYNWFAVNDPRGLAPVGYHIPSDQEWDNCVNYLGSTNTAVKLKSTSGWKFDGNGNNQLGFDGTPAGWINEYGQFDFIGYKAAWWSSSELRDATTWGRGLSFDDFNCWKWGEQSKRSEGVTVRCVKD